MVTEIDDFLSPEECDNLISLASATFDVSPWRKHRRL